MGNAPFTVATMEDFAVELIDQILDHLDSSRDRKALALVSHTFVPLVQRRLFRVLKLSEPQQTDLKTLSIILSDNPDIGLHVQDLFIEIQLGDPAICAPLVRIFRLLKAVRRITISPSRPTFPQAPQHWAWAHWNKDLHMALTTLLTLPSMRGLVLVDCSGVPAALIRYGIASYKEIALQVTEIDFRKIKFPKGSDGPSLQHLILDYSPVASRDFHTLLLTDDIAASLGRLERLELVLPEQGKESFDASKEIIRKYSSSLRHITITARRSDADFNLSTISLPDLPSLQSLSVHTHLSTSVSSHALMQFIVALTPRTPRLQTLTITLDFIDWGTMIRNQNPGAPHMDVDDVLLRLSEVCFSLPGGALASYETLLREKLPRASQAGILSLTGHIVSPAQIGSRSYYSNHNASADTFAQLCKQIM
ncbi:hypothetical protein C8R46DRAFT_46719 [Mycena filopes]|nr:hypothetical protein C8R46DRAFT_46719 [Mycena filopes]